MTQIYRWSWEAGPPGPEFGALLPERIAESPGSDYFISPSGSDTTGDGSIGNPWATPGKAFSTVPLGSIINARTNAGSYSLTGDHIWNRSGSPSTVTTLRSYPPDGGRAVFSGGRILVNGGSYLRLRGFDKINSQVAVEDNIKFLGGATFIDLDDLLVQDSSRQGILVQGTTTGDWQIWNCRIVSNGTTLNLDHGIYVAASYSGVIANCLFYDNLAFGLQLYPNADGIIVTCCTFDGHTGFGGSQEASIGGITIAGEAEKTEGCYVVGCLMTNGSKAINQFWGSGVPSTPNDVQDCIGGGNSTAQEWDQQLGITYLRVASDTDPLYVDQPNKDFTLQSGSPAIDYIHEDNYGYVPVADIDGTMRAVATAGCYARS